ncbi:hypothetical protein, partial [Acetobacter syzygii]
NLKAAGSNPAPATRRHIENPTKPIGSWGFSLPAWLNENKIKQINRLVSQVQIETAVPATIHILASVFGRHV